MLFHSVAQYHSQLKNADLSCADAVQYYLRQIESNKHLNAFTDVYAQEALDMAAALDKKRSAGAPMKKLHGVVIAIKDVICYKGHRVTAASNMLKDFESLYTATALQYLIDEEAIIIGSCNCDEFAMGSSNETSVYGKVVNALDETKVPGGSSGGSAVAVQAGMCMLSLGTDTGGSVRQPADFCGILGMKPGYGIISRYGLIAYASSFDQVGIFGKNISDIALVLEVMAKPDPADSTMNPLPPAKTFSDFVSDRDKKYRIGFLRQATTGSGIDPEIAEKINGLMRSLAEAGNEIIEINFDLLDHIVPAYYVLTTAEASSNLSRYDGIRFGHRSKLPTEDPEEFYMNNRSEGFGAEVKRRIMLGTFVLSAGYYDAYYNKAQQIRRLLVDRTNDMFRDIDALIMPVSPCTAFTAGENDKDPLAMYLADIYTVFANLTGTPAMALPLFSHSNKMPFGVQVLCNRNEELRMFEVGEMVINCTRL